jgi:hypothetical protein
MTGGEDGVEALTEVEAGDESDVGTGVVIAVVAGEEIVFVD